MLGHWHVLLRRAEGLGFLRLEELLLVHAVVRDLSALLAGDASHYWSLSAVLLVLLHVYALTQEVEFYSVQILSVAQPNLHSASAGARVFHRVLINGGLKNVFRTSDTLKQCGISFSRKMADLQINHSRIRVLSSIVVLKGSLTCLKVVGGKHRLLRGLGVTTSNFCLQNGRGIRRRSVSRSQTVDFLIVALQNERCSLLRVVSL